MTITVAGPRSDPRAHDILTTPALAFVERLHQEFAARRDELVAARAEHRLAAATSGQLDFLPETEHIRTGTWTTAPTPPALENRRVEITGPATPAKMAINALNSGAQVWLADLEDASCPTWGNILDAITNLRAAAAGTLAYTDPLGQGYRLRTDAPLAVPVVRPRGWHLDEEHLRLDSSSGEREAIGALVDFGLHIFHVGQDLAAAGRGPYYYLPKLEHHLEARLWNDVFAFAEDEVGIEHGTIRATMLIETIPAAFQMDELLYELRDYAAGLNAGRWDYLFSLIKTFRDAGARFVLPDRADLTMTAPFMHAYTELLVKTCHRRGAMAIGGMAAFIPNRKNPEANAAALAKVRDDKRREVGQGFDGSWVAHPDLVSVCADVFSAALGDQPNQLGRQRDDVRVSAAQLLDIASTDGTTTEAGLRNNLYVATAYLGAWLSGRGAVAIRGLMEDAATAEISRSQVWQQLRNKVALDDTGVTVTAELVERVLDEELNRLRGEVSAEDFVAFYQPAAELVSELCLTPDFVDFLTLPAYKKLLHA